MTPKTIPEREEEILAMWEKEKTFARSIAERPGNRPYVFYDGPPFATGLPHYGHIVASVMKDAVPRYWTMRGCRVERQWGWDCHGLPLENLIEQELDLKDKKAIEAYGIDRFNAACQAAVLRYADEWKKFIPRIGRWVDMEHPYTTMDTPYTESIWWAFKTLHDKKLIYEGKKSMHLCPRCGTTLSNFEVALGYKDIPDSSVIVKFALRDEPKTFFLAWTTTPWTLPGNTGIAVKSGADYIKVAVGDEQYILAKARAEILPAGYQVLETITGEALVGTRYIPIFPFFDTPETPHREQGWRVVADSGIDFVSMEEGTGIVHMAPAFGDEDYRVAVLQGLPIIQHVTKDGRFVAAVAPWANAPVKPKGNHQATDKKIIAALAEQGALFSEQTITHSYPHCWRCETPLLNYLSASWFVKVTALKERMLAHNATINWVPEHVKEGRFGKWLEGARDWAISRSRYWGAPLPVWRCDGKGCEKTFVAGAIADLPVAEKPTDLHRPHIDAVTWQCDCGGTMRRIEDVFDCWFESGSMPFARLHYPFENKDRIASEIPADFIAEGLDQTRGWFYTLLVLSTALFDKPPFKNVIVNGLVLAEDGKKMSKRLKNYPNPSDIVAKYGADALRYYLLTAPVMEANDLCFSEQGVKEVYQKVIMILENVVRFSEMYPAPATESEPSAHVLDRWIRTRLAHCVREVSVAMDAYALPRAVRPIGAFVDDLSTWYVRRSRDRMKGESADANAARQTLAATLADLARLIAPFMPFAAEDVFRRVTGATSSVHLEPWPTLPDPDVALLAAMNDVRSVVELGHRARDNAKMKVRQPLASVKIKKGAGNMTVEMCGLIAEELNVKKVETIETMTEAKDWILETNGTLTIALDTRLTDDLKAEGIAREFIRQVNALRKENGLTIQDRIAIVVQAPPDIETALKVHEQAIFRGALASSLSFATTAEGHEVKIEQCPIRIAITKQH